MGSEENGENAQSPEDQFNSIVEKAAQETRDILKGLFQENRRQIPDVPVYPSKRPTNLETNETISALFIDIWHSRPNSTSAIYLLEEGLFDIERAWISSLEREDGLLKDSGSDFKYNKHELGPLEYLTYGRQTIERVTYLKDHPWR